MSYVTNFSGKTVSVIDGKTNSVTDTIPLGNNPSSIAVNPSTNLVYVITSAYIKDNGYTVSVIDGKTNKVTGTILVNDPINIINQTFLILLI